MSGSTSFAQLDAANTRTAPVTDAAAPKEDQPRKIQNLYASSFAYNVITLTDGALRSIVLLFLVQLQFSAISLSIMFALYELMGVFMNLVGGIWGSTYGMRFLVLLSVCGQIACTVLLMFLDMVFPDLDNPETRNIPAITAYVVVAQMFSGISKDLMKIQGKSVPKLVTKSDDEGALFKIVSILTGMKNSVKGFGYLFGSLLLGGAGWLVALGVQLGLLALIVPVALRWMERDLGVSQKAKQKAASKLAGAFKKGWNVNVLSLARFFLFGSRDLWFEVAAPYFFRAVLMWAPFAVGGFMAGYTIIYGQLQTLTTQLYSPKRLLKRNPNRKDVPIWAGVNGVEILVMGIASYFAYQTFRDTDNATAITAVLLTGICVFAALFAVSSAVHSYLIVSYSNRDKVAMDVGFYYMGNAGGRMVGTLVSGFLYTYTVEQFGLSACLWAAAGFLAVSTVVSLYLRPTKEELAAKLIEKGEANVQGNTANGSATGGNDGSFESPSGVGSALLDGERNPRHQDNSIQLV